jgi:ketosteroid isomerase-like protein
LMPSELRRQKVDNIMTSSAHTKSVRDIIRRESDTFEANFKNGNAGQLVNSYYSENPILSAPDSPAFVGRAAVTDFFDSIMKSFKNVRLVQHVVEAGSDMAYEIASAFLTPREGGAEVECRYVIVWRLENESWRASADMFAFGKLL